MKIKNIILSAVMTAALLAGCGSSPKYDFSDKDLSHAMLVKESVLDKASQQPTEKNVIQKFSNIDEYKYVFERSGNSKEVFSLTTKDDVVTTVRLRQTANAKSEYSIFGIHTGDSKSSAEAIGKSIFAEDGTWSKTGGIESVSFGKETGDKGFITIIFDPVTDKVSSVNYHKAPKG